MDKEIPKTETKKIQLYEKQGETSRYIDVEITENGDLVMTGQDIGKLPEEFWGDSDYEFWVHVATQHKGEVFRALMEKLDHENIEMEDGFRDFIRSRKILWVHLPTDHKDNALLVLIKRLYAGNPKAVDQFKDFMRSQGIPVEFDSWA